MNKHLFVRVFHIVIVGALFLYVGIKQTEIPKFLFPVLLALGTGIVLYHAYKAFVHLQHTKSYWVNLIHILLVGPLLIFIGYNREETPRMYFEMLLMTCFAVIGYHGYYLVQELM